MTPVMKSKQEKVDSKIFDILQDCPETQCSSNCKHTEIQWLILFQFQSPPYLIYGIGPKETEIVTINRNEYTTPPRIKDAVAETVTFPFRRSSYFATWLCFAFYATPCMCIELCWIKLSLYPFHSGFIMRNNSLNGTTPSKCFSKLGAHRRPPIDEQVIVC